MANDRERQIEKARKMLEQAQNNKKQEENINDLNTQKLDDATMEIEDLRVASIETNDPKELRNILDKAQAIYQANFPDNVNSEDASVYSEIAREHLEAMMAKTNMAESIAFNAYDEQMEDEYYVDYQTKVEEPIVIENPAPAPEKAKDVPEIKKLKDILEKIEKETNYNNALKLSKETEGIVREFFGKSTDNEDRKNVADLSKKIHTVLDEKNKIYSQKLIRLADILNEVQNTDDFEKAKKLHDEASKIRDEYFTSNVPDVYKKIANERVDKILEKVTELDRDSGLGQVENDINNIFGEPDREVESEFEEPNLDDKVSITIYNGKYFEKFLVPRGTNFNQPLDAIPVNKNGKQKKLTVKEFDGWLDAYGEPMQFPVVVNDDFEIHASYKVNKKKVLAVAAGAAVGGLAYIADLALPTPIPVISSVGSLGFKLGANVVNKKLANIQQLTNSHRQLTAQKIQNIEEPSPELKALLETEKSLGNWKTFLNTASLACGISAAAHGIRNSVNRNAAITQQETVIQQQPTPQPQQVINQDVVVPKPTPQPVITNEPGSVFTEFNPEVNKVYTSASNALSGTGARNAYMPSFAGQETYQAFFNGHRVMIQPGQSIESILQSVGASDVSEVAVNVMNSNGTPLTWQPLEAMIEGASKIR